MFLTIEQFTETWKHEVSSTAKLLDKLTDESLAKPLHKDVRTLGRAAWHIVASYDEMCARFGIKVDGPTEKDPIPQKAADIKTAYEKVTKAVLEHVARWRDGDLQKEDDMYGQTWKRGKSLWVLMIHEIHHRAQMTVLMRLAGLPVPGVYGPSREEWDKFGMPSPEV